MNYARRIICFCALGLPLLLTACEEYTRTLYFREPGAAKGPWGMATSEVVVREGTNMFQVVGMAARELGMQPLTPEGDSWALKREDNGEFVLNVEDMGDGLWRIEFVDRPSGAGRSRKSRDAEFAVMKALGLDQ